MAYACYIFFDEKITKYHLIGMIAMLTCAGLLGVSSSNDDESDSSEESSTSAIPTYVPVLLALLSVLLMTLASMVSKYFVLKGTISSLQITADSNIL
jgi:drug/metabolite transporter (DMT)-like permease